jgi:hypothetical protein
MWRKVAGTSFSDQIILPLGKPGPQRSPQRREDGLHRDTWDPSPQAIPRSRAQSLPPGRTALQTPRPPAASGPGTWLPLQPQGVGARETDAKSAQGGWTCSIQAAPGLRADIPPRSAVHFQVDGLSLQQYSVLSWGGLPTLGPLSIWYMQTGPWKEWVHI